MFFKSQRTRRVGKQRTLWIYSATDNLRKLHMKTTWKNKAADKQNGEEY